MTKTAIIFAIATIIIIGAVITVIINARPKSIEKEFDGYILWLREAVVFTDSVQFNEGKNFPILGNLTWVEQDDTVGSLYNKARTLIKTEHDLDDIRIIKIRFRGLYKEGGRYGHLGKYSSFVTITNIISYSNIIEN